MMNLLKIFRKKRQTPILTCSNVDDRDKFKNAIKNTITLQHRYSITFKYIERGNGIFVICGNLSYESSEIEFVLFHISDDKPYKRGYLNVQYDYNNKTIYIQEIASIVEDFGYGTLLMEFIKEYSVYNHFTKICGHIQPTDYKRDKEKLYHFYHKNGFSISDTDMESKKLLTWEYSPSR